MAMLSQLMVLWFALIAAPQWNPDAPGRVIASTKEWKITAADFQGILATFPPDSKERFSNPANRRNLLNEVIRIWVLSTEARNKGIAVGPSYMDRRNYYVAYSQRLGSRITDESIRAFYKQHLHEYEKVRLSHILVLNGGSLVIPPNVDPKKPRLPYAQAEKKARDLRLRLQQGAKFAELAKQYSDDPDSGPRGGDFGFISRGQIDRTLEATAFSMSVGQYSEVVGSIFGFHILLVTDKKVPALDELRDQIRQKLISDTVNKDIDPKVKAAAVSIDESYFR
jgi:hypothetical protein